jgi:DNA polymerase-3 subunit chi
VDQTPSIPGIDFFLAGESSGQGTDLLACRVIEKAWKSGNRVLVVTRDESHCAALDDLLWVFSQSSFVPHATVRDDPVAPVCIDDRIPDQARDFQVVVSIHPEPMPKTFHHLRIADIIGASEAEKRAGRKRFRFYRECGIEPRTHRI